MEVNIIDYGMNGEGVAKVEGKVVLVEGALVGEIVDVEITTSFKNYSIAKLNKVVVASANRIKPVCQHYGCGGCKLLHFSYSQQLLFKQQLVKKTIKKVAGINCDIKSTIASTKIFNYRNKASFAVDSKVGFFKTGTHNVIEINECKLLNPQINKVFNLFKNCFNGNFANIKNLVVRCLNNQLLVGVVATKFVDLNSFYQVLKLEFENVGLSLVINTRKDSVVLAGKTIHVGGIKEIELENYGVKYKIDILSFHQTNEDVQNKIYSYVLTKIKPASIVINAYSGAGLLSAIVSAKAKQVVGVELNKASHKMAENLKVINKIKNLQNFNMYFEKFLIKCPKNDIIILDPPKKGCGKVLEKINSQTIIYISCNPISLSKDLRILTKNYIIEEVTPFDMFPNTVSVETVVVLRRKNDT